MIVSIGDLDTTSATHDTVVTALKKAARRGRLEMTLVPVHAAMTARRWPTAPVRDVVLVKDDVNDSWGFSTKLGTDTEISGL
jgi:hypothetical protein